MHLCGRHDGWESGWEDTSLDQLAPVVPAVQPSPLLIWGHIMHNLRQVLASHHFHEQQTLPVCMELQMGRLTTRFMTNYKCIPCMQTAQQESHTFHRDAIKPHHIRVIETPQQAGLLQSTSVGTLGKNHDLPQVYTDSVLGRCEKATH